MRLYVVLFMALCFVKLTNGADTIPITKGFLVYHSYSDYNAWDSKMFLYNFEREHHTEISKNWNIDHAMNGHISPDGTKLVFMGDDKGEPRDWDVYLWEIGSSEHPVNLTHSYERRDEDPKFSPDGSKIVFKQAYWSSSVNDFVFDLKEMDLSGEIINIITSHDRIEESMPYYTSDGESVVYATDGGANGDIYLINSDGTNNTILADESNTQEYYPIVRDSETFFYSRWVSSSDYHDQVYLGYFNGAPAISLPFNLLSADNSDAYPAGEDYAFFSSTRNGGKGAYDLYLGDINTGEVWNLDILGTINTNRNELGPCYNENTPDYTSNSVMESLEKMEIFPNPSNDGVFHVSTNQKYLLNVFDINGRFILRRNIRNSDSIDLSKNETGLYLFVLQSDNELHTKQVFVK